MKVRSLSRARLLVTPSTAAYQAPPAMGFSRQEYWSGVPLPSPKNGHRFCQMLSLHFLGKSCDFSLITLLTVNYADRFSNVKELLYPWKNHICYILLDSTLKTFENFSTCVHEKYSSVVFSSNMLVWDYCQSNELGSYSWLLSFLQEYV